MIRSATYRRGDRRVTIALERVETWLEADDSIINFPGVVELDGDRLYMTIHRARHGDPEGEPLEGWLSDDFGGSWRRAPANFPLMAPHPTTGRNHVDFASGILGYLADGSIARIDSYTDEIVGRNWSRREGPLNVVLQMPEATFRFRRWTRDGAALENHGFQIEGRPWENATYENYASMLELPDGDLLTALLVHTGPLHDTSDASSGPRMEHRRSVVPIRSSDRGASWQFVAGLHPWDSDPRWGPHDREVDTGFGESDVALLPNGDILCVMRTGSYSPLFQSRSTDGGHTWTTPESTGWPAVKPRLRVLPNGVLAGVSGRGGYGHPQVTHVMLSLDGTGTHWEQPFNFHTGPGCSYTTPMVRDGKLHVAFSHSDFTRDLGTHGLPTQSIRCAVFDVDVEAM